jgi:predicted amidophosphoribosyltransferase
VTATNACRRDRRPKPGHCQHCGYDLTCNTSGVCPECGRPAGRETAAEDARSG